MLKKKNNSIVQLLTTFTKIKKNEHVPLFSQCHSFAFAFAFDMMHMCFHGCSSETHGQIPPVRSLKCLLSCEMQKSCKKKVRYFQIYAINHMIIRSSQLNIICSIQIYSLIYKFVEQSY